MIKEQDSTIKELATDLLLRAGGCGKESSLYFTVLNGQNSDDIVGATINSLQLYRWGFLRRGPLVIYHLCRRKDDNPMAFGSWYYSKETISGILRDIKNRKQ